MKKTFLLAACVATATLASCTGKESDYQANFQSVMPWEYDETTDMHSTGNEKIVVEYYCDEHIDSHKSPRQSVYNANSIYVDGIDRGLPSGTK